MEIKNIKGSQGEHYRDVGKKEWLDAMGLKAFPKCQILGCGKDATDAGHVITSRQSNAWYLLPECGEHNENEKEWLKTKATAADNLVKLTSV